MNSGNWKLANKHATRSLIQQISRMFIDQWNPKCHEWMTELKVSLDQYYQSVIEIVVLI